MVGAQYIFLSLYPVCELGARPGIGHPGGIWGGEFKGALNRHPAIWKRQALWVAPVAGPFQLP